MQLEPEAPRPLRVSRLDPSRYNVHQALVQRSLRDRRIFGRPILVSGRRFLQRFTGSEQHTFQFCHPDGKACIPYACNYAHHSPILAVTDEERRVSLIRADKDNSAENEQFHSTYYAHGNTVLDAKWSLDDTLLATGSADHLMRVWDVESQKCLATFEGHSMSLRSVNWHPSNPHLLVTASKDGSFRIWDTRFRQIRMEEEPMNVPVYAAIKAVKDAHTEPVSAKNKKRRLTKMPLASADRSVTCALFLPYEEDKVVSSGSFDGTIKIWDCRAGRDASPIMKSGYEGPSTRPRGITDMKLDKAGARLFSLCLDHSVCVYNMLDLSRPVQRYTDPDYRIGSFYVKLALSPDDRFVLAGSNTHTVFAWETAWPQSKAVQFKGHDAEVTSVSWCESNGTQFASCSDDCSVRLWNMEL